MTRPWHCVWQMPCLSATAKLCQTLLVTIFWPGPSSLMLLIKRAWPDLEIALNAIRDGKPVAELENNGVTNGAAMRVSPLGCLLPARDLDAFIDDVALASSPTHKSDLAIAGAVVVAWAVSRAIDGGKWSEIADALPAIALRAQQNESPPLAHRFVHALNWR